MLGILKAEEGHKDSIAAQVPLHTWDGQVGYDQAGTSKYDQEAACYMMAIMTPLFFGYGIRSALYGKHRSWYAFLVGAAAGGVYTYDFGMMTPQLCINYKLQSVERRPWRAMTYKVMNNTVDDLFAFLLGMPLMHRLSCFRDDSSSSSTSTRGGSTAWTRAARPCGSGTRPRSATSGWAPRSTTSRPCTSR